MIMSELQVTVSEQIFSVIEPLSRDAITLLTPACNIFIILPAIKRDNLIFQPNFTNQNKSHPNEKVSHYIQHIMPLFSVI